MHMRIVWGKILPGQWDAFEAAFKKALEIRGAAKGLKNQWLLRDQNDPDAGYSISQWESDEACAHSGTASSAVTPWPSSNRFLSTSSRSRTAKSESL